MKKTLLTIAVIFLSIFAVVSFTACDGGDSGQSIDTMPDDGDDAPDNPPDPPAPTVEKEGVRITFFCMSEVAQDIYVEVNYTVNGIYRVNPRNGVGPYSIILTADVHSLSGNLTLYGCTQSINTETLTMVMYINGHRYLTYAITGNRFSPAITGTFTIVLPASAIDYDYFMDMDAGNDFAEDAQTYNEGREGTEEEL